MFTIDKIKELIYITIISKTPEVRDIKKALNSSQMIPLQTFKAFLRSSVCKNLYQIFVLEEIYLFLY